MSENRMERARRLRRQVHGDAGEGRRRIMEAFDKDAARYMTEFVFGEVYSRPNLDLRTRELCAVAGLTILGRRDYIHQHVHAALNVGCKPEEIIEAIVQMVVYGGFPSMHMGLTVAMEVFQERGLWQPPKDA